MRGLLPAFAILACLLAAPGRAQTPAAAPSPDPAGDAADPDPDSADLSITATVHYRELKFEAAGTPKVEFSGGLVAPALGTKSQLRTVWHADRGTLPRPVQPGVLYRDGAVHLTITTRFEDLARLFAEDATPRAPSPAPSPR